MRFSSESIYTSSIGLNLAEIQDNVIRLVLPEKKIIQFNKRGRLDLLLNYQTGVPKYSQYP
ncbi:hypothetical protein RvY_04481 [Ramazzottius varieornatus]|uniref:Uncharacterized protein n=1 Tax=Ramazzottius varieornatus TaxID=947166 RepID=A0A1D1URS1_RAMVA|nr:hypothetical protein RvY_04481 [Ramazzottius varieornatus]